MTALRRIALWVPLLVLLVPLTAEAQFFSYLSVTPDEVYKPPGSPSSYTLSTDGTPYTFAVFEFWIGNDGPYYTDPLELDGNGEVEIYVDGNTPEGSYVYTGVYHPDYPEYGLYNQSAPLTVYPAPPPPPVISSLGYGCDNWNCIWILGSRFYPDSRVVVATTDGAVQETHYGPAWQMSPEMYVSGSNDGITVQISNPTLAVAFGNAGLNVQVLNSDGTASLVKYVQAARPSISGGGPNCGDYCVWLSGSFPLDAYLGFRIPGQPDVLPDAYTDLVVTANLITFKFNPSVRYAYDTTGLNAWVVSPTLGNWNNTPYYLAPVDRAVIGYIDDVFPSGGQYYIRGWTCAKTQSSSIDVHIYAGPAGQGNWVLGGTANLASEPAVNQSCNSTGTNHRFMFPIPYTPYPGQPIYAHGISPIGLPNNLLSNSFTFMMPDVNGNITGSVDGITQQAQTFYLSGWACAKTHPGSIEVHVYRGGPSGGGGTFAFSGMANLASEPALATECASTGTNYRFSLPIPASQIANYPGEPLYVHGISPFGLPNLLLSSSGTYTIPDLSITGWVSQIVLENNQYYLKGWACAKTHPGSIGVQLYANGPSGGGGTHVLTVTANVASDPEIATACNSTGTNYRYSILLSLALRQQYGGQTIYVHGESPFSLPNLLLNGSGSFAFPGPVSTSMKEYIYLGDRVLSVETTNLP